MTKFLIVTILVMFFSAFAFKSIAMTTAAVNSQLSRVTSQHGQVLTENVPFDAVYSGTYLCLPQKESGSSQTVDCAFGLELGDGSFIALDMVTAVKSFQNKNIKTNTKVRVLGTFVPIEQISTDYWQKYPITGIIHVKKLEKI